MECRCDDSEVVRGSAPVRAEMGRIRPSPLLCSARPAGRRVAANEAVVDQSRFRCGTCSQPGDVRPRCSRCHRSTSRPNTVEDRWSSTENENGHRTVCTGCIRPQSDELVVPLLCPTTFRLYVTTNLLWGTTIHSHDTAGVQQVCNQSTTSAHRCRSQRSCGPRAVAVGNGWRGGWVILCASCRRRWRLGGGCGGLPRRGQG